MIQKPKKIRLGVLFGGKSAEHEVSIQSAKSIIENLDNDKYDVVPIAIDKEGEWHFLRSTEFFQSIEGKTLPSYHPVGDEKPLAFLPKELRENVDVVFPILHGPMGEDGTVQGLLKLAEIPFVGPGVLSSSVGMDKDVMKRLLRDAKLPVPNFIVLSESDPIDEKKIIDTLGLPLFVKPANMGSSVGIVKVEERDELEEAIRCALQFDRKVILEEKIFGREIECSVLGNDEPMASLPGEVIPSGDFYSYEAKYVMKEGATFKTPADLQQDVIQEVQAMAISAFKALCCEGMARVDFFLRHDGQFFVNELNTIPGFTTISLYPKLWEVSGMPYSELIDYLINLAMQRFKKEKKLLQKPEKV